ncbi:protein DEK isoform X1 [Dendroctonus ponderosae]
MTFAMSTEGDSVKSSLSEANDKNATDNHTDESSQDSVDVKDAPVDKPVENNVNSENVDKPKEESTEGESDQETPEKKDTPVPEGNKKAEKTEENEKEKVDDDVKAEAKKGKSEDEADNEEESDAKKENKPSKEAKNAKEPKDKEEKASTASEKDEEEDEEAEDGEDDADEKPEKVDKKKGVPLLDQPLETSGKRERKNVQRFEEDVKKQETGKVEVEEGSGTALGEIPRVEASITRFKNDDLKFLHRLLFNVQGNKNLFKKNIRKFSGFAFDSDSDEHKKKVEFLKKTELKYLKTTCEILDLTKTGTKDDLVDRIMEFLSEPSDSGKPVGGTGRPKRASAVRANNRGYSSHDDYSSDERHASRARRDKGKRANLKDDSSSDEEFKPGDVSDASDEKPRAASKRKRGRNKKGSSEEDEISLSGGSSEESDDLPKSKRRRSITKANSKGKSKTPSRRGRPAKGATPATRKGKRGRKPKDVSSDEEDGDKIDEGSSSEDEPLAKKKAKSGEPPTDEEIKTFIKSVLDGANLEEITMKTVCQRVYDNYPDFDLTARKNFIKSTVKSLIST